MNSAWRRAASAAMTVCAIGVPTGLAQDCEPRMLSEPDFLFDGVLGQTIYPRAAVTWDPERRALTWEDNGVGMDAVLGLTA